MRLVIRILVTAAALAVAAWLLEGIRFAGPQAGGTEEFQAKAVPVLIVAAILAVINSFVKPVLQLLSLPLILLTLGLFLLVINAAMLLLTAWFAGEFGLGFTVAGFWTALIGSIIISVVSWVLDGILGAD